MPPLSRTRFLVRNILAWLLMTVTIVVLPDTLERWMPLEVARVIGWVVACSAWTIAVESHWKQRVGPFVLFGAQVVLWLSAALIATWISDQARLN